MNVNGVHVVGSRSLLNKAVLRLDEVAEVLQISSHTVRRLINGGQLKAFKPRERLRVRTKDLEEYMECRVKEYTESLDLESYI